MISAHKNLGNTHSKKKKRAADVGVGTNLSRNVKNKKRIRLWTSFRPRAIWLQIYLLTNVQASHINIEFYVADSHFCHSAYVT